ncbi:hypothetical protein [Planococcus faecalis]|uniref:Uncharacterized protein n=1 Tax=Planococcus faecalis TaxID=1598147 RepID=A0ABM6ITP6_9BACL|nr:hypothetical protein [Planococcus faecalis]AQU79737.1 hypothetical protein AJGP001_10880 [Planococcus faecalis]OHX52066.1 hypothetical protein BB777_14135 [Planococcus faecalis]
MKTDEQLLVTYMYEEGYTEEDMYDEHVVKKAFRSIDFHVFKMMPKVKLAVVGIIAAFKKVAEVVKSIWSSISTAIKEVNEYTKYLEQANYTNFSIPPIDFKKRPIIRHQVLNRKPNHMIRKIIH